eukprot:11692376-Alexandrium_andersonii.AAC.1
MGADSECIRRSAPSSAARSRRRSSAARPASSRTPARVGTQGFARASARSTLLRFRATLARHASTRAAARTAANTHAHTCLLYTSPSPRD